MRQKSGPEKQPAEEAIKDIRRATRRHFSAEEKIRVVLEQPCARSGLPRKPAVRSEAIIPHARSHPRSRRGSSDAPSRATTQRESDRVRN
jgi:hypothetical protein